jgi:hypothetical protein
MLKNVLLILIAIIPLAACSHNKPLKAPCTYTDRAGCGGILPMQQKINMFAN